MSHTRTSSKAHLDQRRSVPASDAVEDYAKAIYGLQRQEAGPVSTSALAERLGVAPSSVTAMFKRLDELGLVRYQPYHGVSSPRPARRWRSR
jgi:DtxR family Mn-dependent transcriptional regulator